MKLDNNGNYEQTPGNIAEMFQYLTASSELLTARQQEFIDSVGSQFEATGTISEKQFKWICRYFDMGHIDLEDHDSGRDWNDGHPFDIGDR